MGSIGRFRLVAAVAGMGVLNAFGTTWYAAPSAKGLGDCSSPENAGTVGKAFELAESGTASAWNEISLGAGEYDFSGTVGDVALDGGLSIVSLTNRNYVWIHGVEGVRDGVVLRGGGKSTNARMMTLKGTVALSDITFTNCYSSLGAGAVHVKGGGMTISNCAFLVCGTAQKAGGVYFDNANGNPAVQVAKCLFRGCVNEVASGSAEKLSSACSAWWQLEARETDFIGNTGGPSALYSHQGDIVKCTFTSNSCTLTSWASGAAYPRFGTARKCDFLYNTGAQVAALSASAAVDCTFHGNRTSGNGSCVNVTQADGCFFTCNTNKNNSYAVFQGNASNCVFVSNGGSYVILGEGSSRFSNYKIIRDCVFSNNVCEAVLYGGMNVFDSLFVSNGYDRATGALIGSQLASSVNWQANTTRLFRCTALWTGTKGYYSQMKVGEAYDCLFAYGWNGTTAGGLPHFAYSKLQNCTIVGMKGAVKGIVAAHGSTTYDTPRDIDNCLFIGNCSGDNCCSADFGTTMPYSGCVYSKAATGAEITGPGSSATADSVKFYKPDALHPWGFMPKAKCRNVVDAAADIPRPDEPLDLRPGVDLTRVNPRVNGALDIGCYECWPRSGLLMTVR